ncbi:MAG TPA: AAA family ATPase [Longimicrobiales bacterium]|nr:AAA family ATPase [Longimicrobiales bacterium]
MSRFPGTTPLVGRSRELASLDAFLDGRRAPLSAVLLRGDIGSGKSRLLAEVQARAEGNGWAIAKGRAYPVERGVPYALFSDAFLPTLRSMDAETLTVLSRGGEADLRLLFPALRPGDTEHPEGGGGDPAEFRTRLFWNFAEFLRSYAARQPLLILLEDLQWADPSSLGLIHFLARQASDNRILIVATYSEIGRDNNTSLLETERSLLSLGVAESLTLGSLDQRDVAELVCRTFSVDASLVGDFPEMLHSLTQGNPFFVEEILKSLVARGSLTNRKGRWIGWSARDFALPGSIRDAVLARLASFSEPARVTAELTAVIGARAGYPLLASISSLPEDALLGALEELCTHRILNERADAGVVVYDFWHPLVRETLYQEFGLQRSRLLHGAVAEAMEAHWGDDALAHADELAYHFARTSSDQLSTKALKYLSAAGRDALARHADREAADYLRTALERARSVGTPEGAGALVQDLARAHQRLGEYEEAAVLWARALADEPPDTARYAALKRALGLAAFWCGRREEAFTHFADGMAAAAAAGDPSQSIHLLLIRSHCLQESGRGAEAKIDIESALLEAEALGDRALLARVHRSLALLHVWIGPPAEADGHAQKAIALAREVGDLSVEFWAVWGLAVLWGMTGDTARMGQGIAEATRLADQLRSPVLRLWTAEMSIELAYGTGDWDAAIALGEQSMALARKLNQHLLLPRLMAWTSLLYTGRGDMERAGALVDEACRVSGMHEPGADRDVHLVVPAHICLANYLVARGEYQDAMSAARRGLEIAEGTGYNLWAVHRLLPILAEACLWAEEVDEAERLGRRLREYATAMDHKLGIAWADACDAMVTWKRGDPEGGALAMRRSAEALERIPMIPYAVRIRRQLAGRLAEIGDTEGAVAELRQVHDVFVRLGAESELEKTRIQFREVGHRPPPRGSGEGMAGLTERELEIARQVARRKSNKAIGKDLAISPRTVSTHLSNIFQKLDVSSRAALGDLVREQGLLED